MPDILQVVVPLATPLPPLSLLHVTLFIPLALSEAVPPRLIGLLEVAYVESAVGLVMATMGTVVSRIIESLVVFDILFKESLNHAYIVLLPSPLLNVYGRFSL